MGEIRPGLARRGAWIVSVGAFKMITSTKQRVWFGQEKEVMNLAGEI